MPGQHVCYRCLTDEITSKLLAELLRLSCTFLIPSHRIRNALTVANVAIRVTRMRHTLPLREWG